jgi:anti-sigma factor RsiW
MTDRISTRDWDDLSAYLDGQLNTKEQTRVETRLRQDADFRSALEELRRTRAVVHSLPKLRAPRSFLLTPEMAGQKTITRQARPAFPVLRFASVIATVLLFITLFGDWYTSRIPALQLSATQAALNLAAPKAGAELPLETQPLQAFQEQPTQAPPPAAALPAGEAQLRSMAVPEATPGETALDMQTPTTTLATEAPQAAEVLQAAPTEVAVQAQSLAAESTTEALSANAVQPAPPAEGATRSAWKILELLLAVIAILTGLLAVVFSRRRDSTDNPSG